MFSHPESAHRWVAWLFANLIDIRSIGQSEYVGRLPENIDFATTLDNVRRDTGSRVLGLDRPESREIEFSAIAGHHYESLEELISWPANWTRVPTNFTLRDSGFTWPTEAQTPVTVEQYRKAVEAWGIFKSLADHVVENPLALHFINSPESRVEIKPKIDASQLRSVEGLDIFDRDFARADLHKEQKRSIVRTSLVDIFKGKSTIVMGDVLIRFPEIIANAKASYATYTADFSYQKVRSEVEKQNLNDTLRLNKTIADIQNQLLALPAALLLAGAGLKPGETVENVTIVLAVTVFVFMMWGLISNQDNSIDSIATEVALRKRRLQEQPIEISEHYLGAFSEIDRRVIRQKRVLFTIRASVILVWIFVACVALAQTRQPRIPSAATDSAMTPSPASNSKTAIVTAARSLPDD